MGQQHINDRPSEVQARTEPASQRVKHLLTVARAEFVERGFDAVSIDSIARAGGISKETIYRHYPEKEALFRAALEAAGEEFTARAQVVHEAAGDPRIELAGLARTILDSALDQGMFSALWVAASVAQRMPDLAASLHEGQWQRMEPVRQTLEDYARRQGVTGHVPLEMALDFGSLSVEGPAVLMGLSPPADRNRFAAHVALLFSQGIGAVMRRENEGAALSFRMPAEKPVSVSSHIRTLLEVAARHFLDQGYEGANLDLIGAEARVGRGTLYRHFGSKAGLFAAAMQHCAHACVPSAIPSLPSAVIDRSALAAFLEEAIASLTSLASIRLHHVAISQSRRDPDVARTVFTILRAGWVKPLSDWLQTVGLRVDPEWHGRQLLVLASRGNRLFAGGQEITAADRRRHAERAVAIFLDGFASLL